MLINDCAMSSLGLIMTMLASVFPVVSSSAMCDMAINLDSGGYAAFQEDHGATVYIGQTATPDFTFHGCNADPERMFEPVWSASKFVTALTAVKLASLGVLDLDAPISLHLDFWTNATEDERSGVTMRLVG